MDERAKTQQLFPPQSPSQWKAYWRLHNQAWRTEAEIDHARQEELEHLRFTQTDQAQDCYAFKDKNLERADIEWLLATHKSFNEFGPVDYANEQQWRRRGIDIGGAQLARVDLSNLPLARMIGGYTSQGTTNARKSDVTINLERASLVGVHLEAAELNGAYLKKADLSEAYLDDAQLKEAHLEGVLLTDSRLKDADLTGVYLEGARINRAYAEETIFRAAHLEDADFSEAHLEGADLRRAFLNNSKFIKAFLEGADFGRVHVGQKGADFTSAYLAGASFVGAQLRGVNFSGAHLEGVDFASAYLEDADFSDANLAGVNFQEAHLEGANFRRAHLEGKKLANAEITRIKQMIPAFPEVLPAADLREAFFSSATRLKDAVFGNKEMGFISIADLSWGDVNLNVIDWEHFLQPGDEYRAKNARHVGKDRILLIEEYSAAVRANRQLAVILQSQGLNEIAVRFSYSGQILQRTVLRLQKKYIQYLFSFFLDLLTGYGYKPLRSFVAYIIVDLFFMVIYHALKPDLSWLDAFIVSVTTFGRGLTPGQFSYDDPIALFSIVEAFLGLMIEATFIAALTQRLFGK